jgi:IS4 transposase
LPALEGRRFYDRLFNPLITLWYLLFQRLHPDHTLDAALADARSGGGDRLKKGLSRRLRSDSTCSYSLARRRLPWQFLAQALHLQAAKIIGWSPTVLWQGRVLALLDGSTLRLRPSAQIAREFPPHANQHRKAYWCLMRVVVCFCAQCGAALDCALGSMHLSEQVLACEIILRAKAKCLFMGDRNFGIFRLAQTARQAGQEVLLRLTDFRARRLLGRALRAGQYELDWKPTRHDQLQPGASTEPVRGRLLVLQLQRRGFRSQRLCLFTTLPASAEFGPEELARLYGLRWHVELNLRYLKAQMDLKQLEVKSPEMARKEWLAGLLAYNLIRAAQLCAALQTGLSPLKLSFSSVRRRLEHWLNRWSHHPRQATEHWAKTLQSMGRCAHANRRKARPNEPRAQRYLRSDYPPLIGSRALARRQNKKYASKS